MLGGIVVLYVFGIAGLMAVGRLGIDAAATALMLYLPGDVIKAVVAALVARGVHAGYPGAPEQPPRREAAATPV